MANPELPPGQGWMARSPLEVQFQNKFRVVSGAQWLIIVSSTSRPSPPPTTTFDSVFSVSVLTLTVVDGVVVVVLGVGVVVLLLVVVVSVVEGGILLGSGVAERSSSQGGMAWLVVDWARTESQV